jgi:hypothetical protein
VTWPWTCMHKPEEETMTTATAEKKGSKPVEPANPPAEPDEIGVLVDTELRVMRSVVGALKKLPSDASRLRVLAWTRDVFGAKGTGEVQTEMFA